MTPIQLVLIVVISILYHAQVNNGIKFILPKPKAKKLIIAAWNYTQDAVLISEWNLITQTKLVVPPLNIAKKLVTFVWEMH